MLSNNDNNSVADWTTLGRDKMIVTETCPCRHSNANIGSAAQSLGDADNLSYAQCCQYFHNQEVYVFDSAEALMRSRYCAFQLQLEHYLLKTWHPSTRPENLHLDDAIQYLSLNVVSSDKERVHFFAIGRNEDGFFCLEETSTFIREQTILYYLNGEATIQPYQPSRNDLCPCRSGKKYKKCCA